MTICWVDLETTGLHPPNEGVIMEVACIMTTDQLTELGRINIVHHEYKNFEAAWALVEPIPCAMHGGNGLYAEVFKTPSRHNYTLDTDLCTWWGQLESMHSEEDFSEVIMGGNTIHFDRAWLKHHCPKFEAFFNYRNFDMSTMNAAVRRWAPGLLLEETMAGDSVHRAMSDVGGLYRTSQDIQAHV